MTDIYLYFLALPSALLVLALLYIFITKKRNTAKINISKEVFHEMEKINEKFNQILTEHLKNNHDRLNEVNKLYLEQTKVLNEKQSIESKHIIEQIIAPVSLTLKQTREQLEKLEHSRKESLGSISAQIEMMRQGSEKLFLETQNLTDALKRPEVRGQWGEMTLKRCLELSGLKNHFDFTEQQAYSTEEGRIIPDLVIHLPNNKNIIIDAKTPMNAYLKVISKNHTDDVEAFLEKHARHLRDRIDELAKKEYWNQFSGSANFIVMFLPTEDILTKAINHSPDLFDYALKRDIVLSTPTTLLGLLKTVAYTWDQSELNENAKDIVASAETLYERLSVFINHFSDIGNRLNQSVLAFNRSVSTLNKRINPAFNKLGELINKNEDVKNIEQLHEKAIDDTKVIPFDKK